MNVADLIKHTANTIWARKHLMVLGTVFVIVTSGLRLEDLLLGPLIKPLFALFDLPGADLLPVANTDWLARLLEWVDAHGTAGWASLVIGVLLLGVTVGVISIVMQGALIASAGSVDEPLSLGAALRAGWRKAWRGLPVICRRYWRQWMHRRSS